MAKLKVFELGILLMVIPALGSASVLSDLAATLKPGEFAELDVDETSVSTCQAMIPILPERHPQACKKDEIPDHPDGCLIPRSSVLGNILEFTDEALLDPTTREIYIMGTRRPYQRWDQGFVKYSEETNSWTILDLPPFGVGAHGYDNGAIDVSRRHYYWSRIGQARRVWSMDIATNTWTRLPDAPISAGQFSAIEYFPEIDRLVFFDGLRESEYALYNPDNGKWEAPVSLDDAPFGGISHFSEYSPTHGVMFFGGGFNYSAGGTIRDLTPNVNESRRFYMLDENKVVRRLANAPTMLGQRGAGPVQTIDPNTGNLVVFQGEPNDQDPNTICPADPLPIWEHDLTTDTWNQTGTQKLSDRWCGMDTVAVPLYEHGVNFVVSVKGQTNCKVYLYRHSSGTGELSINVQPTAVTVNQGQVAMFLVQAIGSGPHRYQWRRNGAEIPGATAGSYSFTALNIADNGAVFDVVVSNNTKSINSFGATLTMVEDTIAPTLASVSAASSSNVSVIFSEAVNTTSAENIDNYQIDPKISVTSASLSGNGRTASLTVNSLTEEIVYTLSVSNVQDLAQTPNTLAQSSINFTYRSADGFEDGNADGWEPYNDNGNTLRWSVVEDEGDMAYYLNTTKFDNLSGNRLGEYSLLPEKYGDFTFTAQAKLGDDVTVNSLADYAVVFGFEDSENYYFVMFNNRADATQLFKVINGSRTALSTNDVDWLTDNEYHHIEISRVGSEIKVYFDGDLMWNVVDDSLGVGQVGIGSYNDSAYFDDVSVTGESSISDPGNSAVPTSPTGVNLLRR